MRRGELRSKLKHTDAYRYDCMITAHFAKAEELPRGSSRSNRE